MYQHSVSRNHKAGTNPLHQRDSADRFVMISTTEIAGGRSVPFVTSAADVKGIIPATSVPKAGDTGATIINPLSS